MQQDNVCTTSKLVFARKKSFQTNRKNGVQNVYTDVSGADPENLHPSVYDIQKAN